MPCSAATCACSRCDPAPRRLFRRLRGYHRSDIVAMALTLGVLLFAVVSAITLVRTRLRAASADAAFRDEIMALKAERDRFNALLMSEPQILVSWAAADNEPDILGDTTLVTSASHAATRAGVRLLARAGQGAGHGARGRCAARRGRRLLDAIDDAGRPRHRGRRPRHRRPRRAAAARRQRAEARAGRAQRPPREARQRDGIAAHADRCAAVAGLDARHRRRADLRQPGLCPRGRGQGPGRRAGAVGRAAHPRRPRRGEPGARRRQELRDAHAGDRRRLAAQFRRARRADPQGQRRHRHRRHRSRGDAERAQPPQRRPPPHARSTGDRRRHLHRRPAPDVLQRGLSLALGARRRLPRPEPDRFRRARSTARSAEAARGDRTSANGRPPCTRPIARPRPASMSGICPTAAPFASSPRPIRRAA